MKCCAHHDDDIVDQMRLACSLLIVLGVYLLLPAAVVASIANSPVFVIAIVAITAIKITTIHIMHCSLINHHDQIAMAFVMASSGCKGLVFIMLKLK